MEIFENSVFMLSCGRAKTYLFENDDVTSLVLHSQFNKQKLFVSDSSVSVWTEIFLKTLVVWTQIFSKTDKNKCVFKNIRIRVDEALVF